MFHLFLLSLLELFSVTIKGKHCYALINVLTNSVDLRVRLFFFYFFFLFYHLITFSFSIFLTHLQCIKQLLHFEYIVAWLFFSIPAAIFWDYPLNLLLVFLLCSFCCCCSCCFHILVATVVSFFSFCSCFSSCYCYCCYRG